MSEWLWWDDLAAGIPRKFSLSYSTALIRLMVPAFPASATLAFVPACFHMGVRGRHLERTEVEARIHSITVFSRLPVDYKTSQIKRSPLGDLDRTSKGLSQQATD